MTDNDGIELVREVVTEEILEFLSNRLEMLKHSGAFGPDSQVPGCVRVSADPVIETFLLTMQPRVESLVGRTLYPTYSIGRLYRKGARLKRHIDRPSCEFSLTVPVWSERRELDAIFFEDPDLGRKYEVNLGLGDMLLYQGCKLPHWRKPATCEYFNVFLHYVDASGPYSEWRYDKRRYLTI